MDASLIFTRVNVIPADASAVLDVRVARKQGAAVIDRKLRSLQPFKLKCKICRGQR